MEQSAGEDELSSGQEKPLDAAGDAVEATQGVELEPQGVQDQGNVGEGSIQAASGVAFQSTQGDLGLESRSLQDVKRGTSQAIRVFAVQPPQTGLGREFHNFQDQPNAEEVAIQANSGAAVQLTQAGSRLEPHDSQEQPNVEEGAIQPIHGVVVQPMQASMGLESRSLQEQPNVEDVGVQPTQATLPNPSNPETVSMEEIFDMLHTLADQEEHEIIEEILQIVTGQVEASHQEEDGRNGRIVLQDPFSEMNNLRSGQVEASYEGETGSNDGIMMQTSPSDMSNIRDVHVETSHQEEEAGTNDRIMPQGHPVDMNNLRNDGWIELADLDEPMDDEEDIGIQARVGHQQMQNEPSQQGTAGRRIRLQVPLCGAEGLSEAKSVSIASSERSCMCGGMPLEQQAKFLPAEPAELLCKDATGFSARVTMQDVGDMIGPSPAEGSITSVTNSDHPDVAQRTSQDVSGSSLTSLIQLLGFLGDACILPAVAAELSDERDASEDGFNSSVGYSETDFEDRQSMVYHQNSTRPFLQQMMMPSDSTEAEITKMQHEPSRAVSSGDSRKPHMGCGSDLARCLFWIATLVLIFLCLFRSFCRLTRMAFASV